MAFEAELEELEESLWREETRFDPAYMESVLAADFVEFGRSGRVFSRTDSIHVAARAIGATFPLASLAVYRLDDDVYLVTYISEVTVGDVVELANRSSLWIRSAGEWELRFHQGTPL